MRALREELDQRQHALEESARDLQRVSELRREAAAAVQQLEERSAQLAGSLDSAGRQTTQVDALCTDLEGRAQVLRAVETRVGHFEEKLTTFERMERDIARSLEHISSRQGTVEALQADLDRMFKLAEKTAADVRTITKANRRIEESRELLDEVMGRLQEVRDTKTLLEQRKRQMTQAEERLARAESLLIEIRSSLELLQGQKVMVDHAVEKAGTLRFLLKQAEATIDELRDERNVAARLRALTEASVDEEGEARRSARVDASAKSEGEISSAVFTS
jgi:chromosome segregation ATPase